MKIVPDSRWTQHKRYVLLAPDGAYVPPSLQYANVDEGQHESLLGAVQRLRAKVYLEDGAIAPWQLSEGRHIQGIDERSWHMLVMGDKDTVLGCVRYTSHQTCTSPFQLGILNAALTGDDVWAERLERALGNELLEAKRRAVDYAEIGGWAITPELRGTTEALRMALSVYALGSLFGGALGITTATTRHNSSSILRRIGGQSLVVDGATLPTYFDPKYQCYMEILRFDSLQPNPRYFEWIHDCAAHLRNVQVLGAGQLVGERPTRVRNSFGTFASGSLDSDALRIDSDARLNVDLSL